MTATAPAFVTVEFCWVCSGTRLDTVHTCRFDLSIYAEQDPDLAAYAGMTVDLRRCRRCGFGQPAALPALPAYFARMYDQRWSPEWVEQEFVSGTKTVIFQSVLSELERRVGRGGRLLDVGAHVGRLLHLAAVRGWQVEGLEPNPTTAAFAARRTGAPIHCMPLEGLGAGCGPFDALTLIDVLEHLPEPVAVLNGARGLLRPGGWMAIKVPCGPSQLRKERLRALLTGRLASVADNLVHVSHFSPRSLREALQRAGFSGIHVTVGAPELHAGHGAGRLERARANFTRLLAFGLARAVPGGVHSPLAFNLQAYACAKAPAC